MSVGTPSIWPHDTAAEEQPRLRQVGALTCFVISPFQPKARFDDLFGLVNGVCQQIRAAIQLESFESRNSNDNLQDTISNAPDGNEESKLA
jgi:hypothetical protein